MNYHIATFPFVHSPINPSDIMNQTLAILVILSFLSGAFGSSFPSKHIDLEKQLEMAHFHQSVLEGDKSQLEACVDLLLQKGKGEPRETGEVLDEMIINLLRGSSKNVRQMLVSIKAAFPHIEKGEINSRLYAMLNKGITKFERVNGEKAPLWSVISGPSG